MLHNQVSDILSALNCAVHSGDLPVHTPIDGSQIGSVATATSAEIDAALNRAQRQVDLAQARTLVGTGGTVTTIAAHALGLATYQRDRVHLSRVGVPDTLAACADLARLPRWRRSALGFMHPGRVDVIVAGALLWRRLVEVVAARSGVRRVVTSEHDILDGIAGSLGRPTW